MVHRRNILSIIIIISLAIVLLLSIMAFFLSLAKLRRIKGEIASKYEMINRLTEKSKMPLTKESLLFVTNEENKYKIIYNRFKLALESPLNERVRREELDPLQFKERLIQTQKKLREDATMYNLLLPESLGFAKYEIELSKPSEIPDLIRRLRVLEELIYMITLSGVETLHEINFADKEVKRKTDIYFHIPISFKIGCTSPSLTNFLYKLRLSPFNFIVDDMDIESAQARHDRGNKETLTNERLVASLSVRAVALY